MAGDPCALNYIGRIDPATHHRAAKSARLYPRQRGHRNETGCHASGTRSPRGRLVGFVVARARSHGRPSIKGTKMNGPPPPPLPPPLLLLDTPRVARASDGVGCERVGRPMGGVVDARYEGRPNFIVFN
jgi:hypothetical protein